MACTALEPSCRCIAFRTMYAVLLQSRQLRPLARYSPEVSDGLVEQLPDGAVVDSIWGISAQLDAMEAEEGAPLQLLDRYRRSYVDLRW